MSHKFIDTHGNRYADRETAIAFAEKVNSEENYPDTSVYELVDGKRGKCVYDAPMHFDAND